MPTQGFGRLPITTLYSENKFQRQSIIRHEGKNWRVVERTWCRREKQYRHRLYEVS